MGIGLREVVLPGLRWVVGDGKSTKFWQDHWLVNNPLMEEAEVVIPEEFVHLRVRDLWIEGLGWDLSWIEPFVSRRTRLSLAAVVVDSVTGAKDRLSWAWTADGSFTVKSAYSFLTRGLTPQQNMSSFFDLIWRATILERECELSSG